MPHKPKPRQVIKAKDGLTVKLDEDADAQARVIITTPDGHKLAVVRDAGSVRIMDGIGRAIRLDASGVTVESGSRVSIVAPVVEITGSIVTVNAAVTKFAGVVEADTVKCNTVIASSYTPGAGNVW
jgi:glycine cleavage system H lipoate-binding protein